MGYPASHMPIKRLAHQNRPAQEQRHEGEVEHSRVAQVAYLLAPVCLGHLLRRGVALEGVGFHVARDAAVAGEGGEVPEGGAGGLCEGWHFDVLFVCFICLFDERGLFICLFVLFCLVSGVCEWSFSLL